MKPTRVRMCTITKLVWYMFNHFNGHDHVIGRCQFLVINAITMVSNYVYKTNL